MSAKEIEDILNYMKQYVENEYQHDSEPMLNYKDLQIVLPYIEELKQKAALASHYKHLYSEVKKQKDNVVEYVKKQSEFIQGCDIYQPLDKDIILRMLGETE